MSKVITHGSTFSGIGAPEVAAAMLGWENVFHCEINPFGRKVLDYYFPNAESYEDITKTDFSKWRDKITVLTGGFPCQPFSYAGKRRGSEDDRYLWPFMLRCIEQVRPRWFVGENVAGITTMAFPGEDVKVGVQTDLFGACDEVYEKHERYVLDEICESLERAGYSVQPILIPACAVGAPHRRDRVFIVAHLADQSGGTEGISTTSCEQQRTTGNTADNRLQHDSQRQCCDRSIEATFGEGCSSEQTLSAETSGSSRPIIDTNSERLSRRCKEIEREQTDGGLQSELQRYIERHGSSETSSYTPSQRRREIYEQVQSKLADGAEPFGNGRERTFADTESGTIQAERDRHAQHHTATDEQHGRCNWASGADLYPENRWRTFPSVSPVYRGNDGLPFPVDDLTIPFSEWKRESLKAYGNAIVPQVMYEIFRGIDQIERGIAE